MRGYLFITRRVMRLVECPQRGHKLKQVKARGRGGEGRRATYYFPVGGLALFTVGK